MSPETIVHIGSEFQRVQFEQIRRTENLGEVLFIIENLNDYGEGLEQSGHMVIKVNSSELNLRNFKLKDEIDRLRESYTRLIGKKKVSRLIVASINNISINLLLIHYHIGEIWKYEDGMLDYLPSLKEDSLLEVLIKHIIFRRYSKYTRYQDRNSIVSRQFYINSNYGFDGRQGERIKIDVVEGFTGNKILFLTQSLSEDNVLSLKDEIACYRSVLLGLKVNEVVLKPHPRSSKKKLSLLKTLASEIGVEFLASNSTAEDLLRQGRFKRVIGCYSNTIFYSELLFGSIGESYLGQISKKNRNLKYVYTQLKALDTNIKWL